MKFCTRWHAQSAQRWPTSCGPSNAHAARMVKPPARHKKTLATSCARRRACCSSTAAIRTPLRASDRRKPWPTSRPHNGPRPRPPTCEWSGNAGGPGSRNPPGARCFACATTSSGWRRRRHPSDGTQAAAPDGFCKLLGRHIDHAGVRRWRQPPRLRRLRLNRSPRRPRLFRCDTPRPTRAQQARRPKASSRTVAADGRRRSDLPRCLCCHQRLSGPRHRMTSL
mmetsp:Transcript_96983/g.279103  ORF Transcript_96983/g.279103 Transcript_96983/m.279103 type:complete len:224 (+) Transcript_96983:87-758(+)